MKKLLLGILLLGAGVTANASSGLYCMTTNHNYCQDCSVQTYCRETMDVEQVWQENGRYLHNTIAVGVCGEEVNKILNSDSCH